jgi:serine/threonine-protein kinase
VLAWCSGVPALTAADHGRVALEGAERERLHTLCANVLDAYARLHELGIVHGDVHPGNVLVDGDGSARVIDFGYSRAVDEARYVPRGGVGFFYEPEYARAALEQRTPPLASPRGEQYAVAALVFRLVTGSYYVDFSLDADTMMRQVAQSAPASFEALRGNRGPRRSPCSCARSPRIEPTLRVDDRARASVARAHARRARASGRTSAARDADAFEGAVASFLTRVTPGGELFEAGVQEAPLASSTWLGRDRLCALSTGVWRARNRVCSISQTCGSHALESQRAPNTASAIRRSNCRLDGRIRFAAPHRSRAALRARAPRARALRGRGRGFALEVFGGCVSRECESSELLFGRAGVLLALANLLAAQPQWKLREFGDTVMARLWSDLDAFAPIGECEQLAFLGSRTAGAACCTRRCAGARRAAHLCRIDSASASLNSRRARALRPRRALSAAWLSPAHPRHPHDYVPGWCNGARGSRCCGSKRTRARAMRAMRNSPSVARGPRGSTRLTRRSVLRRRGARLRLARGASRDRRRRVAHAAPVSSGRRAIPSIRQRTLRRDSLYKGEPGVAVLASDLLAPERAAMPFFETEWRSRA